MGNSVSTDRDGQPRSGLARVLDPVGLCFQPSTIESSTLLQEEVAPVSSSSASEEAGTKTDDVKDEVETGDRAEVAGEVDAGVAKSDARGTVDEVSTS